MAKCEVVFLLFLVVASSGESMRLELRRATGSGYPIGKLVEADKVRGRMIVERVVRKEGAETAVRSAADYGAGTYLAAMRVGTPPRTFSLIADTGSDLTWVNCAYNGSASNRRRRRVFMPSSSSSFRTIPCISEECRIGLANMFSLSRCPARSVPCAFDYRYSDGSSAEGVFANETVTLGGDNVLHDVLIGCSDSVHGENFRSADGVLGLAFSRYSFATAAARTFKGKFSYCLVDHLSPSNATGYLTFGDSPSLRESSIDVSKRRTPLVLGVLSPFYGLQVRGISIGNEWLDIPPGVWDANRLGGTILDSGTSLTTLTSPAYRPVIRALRRRLGKFPRIYNPAGVPLEYCFNSTGFKDTDVPRLRFHLADGAAFLPPVKSYAIDVADGVKCLGFVSTDWPGPCVIGNILQQNHVWEFDLLRGMLGFARSHCAS